MIFLLSELAEKFDLEFCGKPDAEIRNVASLASATEGDICFCTGKHHLSNLEKTNATAVILDPAISADYRGNVLLSENPQLVFSRIIRLIHPPERKQAGIHPSAIIHDGAVVSASASVAENVIIEDSVTVGADCEIAAGCFLGEGTTLGEGTVLNENVTLHHQTVVGSHCVLYSGCVIGSDGFGHVRDGDHWIAVPQIGRVVLGNHVRVGANTTIDRGALGDTQIGNGVKIDNLVHIAHNVCIGDDTAIAACSGFAGSTVVGKRCTFAGQCGIADNIRICDDAHFTGQSAVRSDILKPGVYSSGILLDDTRSWARNAMRFKRLDELFKQVRDLTKKQV